MLAILCVLLVVGVVVLVYVHRIDRKLDVLLSRSEPPGQAVSLGLTAGPITEQPDSRRR